MCERCLVLTAQTKLICEPGHCGKGCTSRRCEVRWKLSVITNYNSELIANPGDVADAYRLSGHVK